MYILLCSHILIYVNIYSIVYILTYIHTCVCVFTDVRCDNEPDHPVIGGEHFRE